MFTIERDGTVVRYLRNGVVFHTSARSASGSWLLDTSFKHAGTAIGDALISFGDSGVTRHSYDTGGQRTVRLDADGTTTIYLGGTELRWTLTGTKVARSYRSRIGSPRRRASSCTHADSPAVPWMIPRGSPGATFFAVTTSTSRIVGFREFLLHGCASACLEAPPQWLTQAVLGHDHRKEPTYGGAASLWQDLVPDGRGRPGWHHRVRADNETGSL